MQKLDLQTFDSLSNNIEALQKLFPQVITEKEDENGKIIKAIDFDLFKQHFSKELVEGDDERYRLDWPGKKASILKANTPINKTLRPVPEDSVNFDTTQNLYIEGDNFEVLKILQESYLGKIKMIYIDPPYNTGKDFVYKDNFRKSVEEYNDELGVVNDEGGKLFRNTDTNGRFHSDWLSMMYERLVVARDLLRDDGVIFMSIDDNEVHNLRKICDEIFGEDNVETLIWNKEANGSSGTLKQTSTTRRIHEYIICVFKNFNNIQFNKVREPLIGREDEFQTANLAVNQEKEKIDHKNYFTITNPSGDTFTKQWKWSESEINELIKQDLIYWGSDGHKQPRLIIPTDERRTTFLLSILNYGGTTIGRKDFESLMGENIEFSYPKPVILLKKIIETTTVNDIILDFFSGSATTAHAVMQLNAEDGGNRKFIMVQIPELTDETSEAYKAGYKNICEIGKERIRRAGKKILEEIPPTPFNKGGEKIEGISQTPFNNGGEKIEGIPSTPFNKGGEKIEGISQTPFNNGELVTNPPLLKGEATKSQGDSSNYEVEAMKSQGDSKLDIGFRVYKVDSSNMKDVYFHPSEIDQKNLFNIESNIKEDRTPLDLLTGVMLDLGLTLDLPIQEKAIAGNTVYFVAGNSLVACFDEFVDFAIVDEIAKLEPLKVVFRDASFRTDSDKINFETRFKKLSPETVLRVI